MRVLFLTLGADLPSSRVRVLDLLPDLRAAGIEPDVLLYPRSLSAKLAAREACKAADVVVVQKKLPTFVDARLLRRWCRRLVYDFDDAVYFRHETHRGTDHPTSRRRFLGFLPRVDLVLAGNRILAAAAAGHGPPVEVLPSAVETRGVPTKSIDGDGALVVGWIGGTINLGQAALLAPALRRLSKDFRLEYRIVCSRGLELEGVKTTMVPWSLETQAQEVARFDIGVMPLPPSPHAEGKCAYKALQYMAAAVPPIVSDVGINREVVRDGECGLVAATIEDFEPLLRRLAQDAALRRQLGLAARTEVERAYSVEVVARRLAGLLHEVAGNRRRDG